MRSRKLMIGGATLVAAAAAWVFLAPHSLGGRTVYEVTYGISMEPAIHRGDLAVVRPATSYAIGDVVGYRNPQLHRVVLHRIVGVEDGRFVMKGDNNSFLDTYHPAEADMVGKLWVHVPTVGRAFIWFRHPAHASLSSGLLSIPLLLLGGAGVGRRRRRSGRPQRPAPDLAVLLVPALVGVVVFGGLALLAFRHAPARAVEVPGAYVQRGSFGYDARARTGIVYPQANVGVGQPLFTSLVRRVRFAFAYRFESTRPHRVHGTLSLGLALTSAQGWTRALPAPRPLPFDGTPVEVEQVVDLDAVQHTLERYLDETALANDTFTLQLVPHVRVLGEVDGTPIDEAFEPTPLSFGLDNHVLRILSTGPVTSGPGAPAANPLRPSKVGSIEQTKASTMHALLVHARVTVVRRVALLGAAVFGALLAILLVLRYGLHGDELTRIRQRYGRLLVAVTNAPKPGAGYVDVTSFDGLAQIAASREAVILQHAGGFYVEADGAAYRYRLAASPTA
jgi:signal peptidase